LGYHLNKYIYNSSKRKWCKYTCFPLLFAGLLYVLWMIKKNFFPFTPTLKYFFNPFSILTPKIEFSCLIPYGFSFNYLSEAWLKYSERFQNHLIVISVRQNAVWTSLDFPGLPRTFTCFCENYARISHFRP